MGHELATPNPWMILPFALLLSSMALAPWLCPRWWERHYPKLACGLGAVTVGYYLFALKDYSRVTHVGYEYISFIVLIGSLFVVSGGIHIRVTGEATPSANTLFLLVGALSANLLGTTGASMLLIRPWLRMNQHRVTAHHVVFFIFLVSNVGGCLTPVGDPPLFLGYLKGIPFWWVAKHCWPMWLLGVGFLLAVFYGLDRRNYRRAPREVRAAVTAELERWRVEGLWNLVYLLAILAAVFINHPLFLREALMTGAAAASWLSTRKSIHEANHFDFHPLREVTLLFAGVFATMLPALDWLQLHASRLADPSPAFFFWASGVLSSLLDNAPTYLGFFTALSGLSGSGTDAGAVAALLNDPAFAHRLVALSVGAVFFGANTYIGNGPNFMVKSIAEQQRVRTPGFLGFVLRYTLPCLVPLLIALWALFFRS